MKKLAITTAPTIQEFLDKEVHALFKNDRKKIFPFLKIALGRTVRSSKEIASLSDKEAMAVWELLRFFVSELDKSYGFGDVKGGMHRHFLWSATRLQLQILYLMRNSRKSPSKILRVDPQWVIEKQYNMLAHGAALGQFSHIESYTLSYCENQRHLLAELYCSDLEQFAARIRFCRKNFSSSTCLIIAAYYSREMLAKTMFGGNFEQKDLTTAI